MKDSDKGLLAVAVVVGYLYMSKRDPNSDMRWGGAMYPKQSNVETEERRLAENTRLVKVHVVKRRGVAETM